METISSSCPQRRLARHFVALIVASCAQLAAWPLAAQVHYSIIDLGALGIDSAAFSINASGQVAGQSANHAFRWDINTKPAMRDLLTLGGNVSVANGINASGQIAGTSELSGGINHAFRYDSGTMVDLAIGVQSFGNGINVNGTVVGYSIDALNLRHAFRAPGGLLIYSGNAQGYGIDNLGDVVGTFVVASGDGHAFRTPFDQGILDPARDDLGTLGGRNAVARAINDSGQVVGYSTTTAGPTHAFRTAPNSPINPATDDLGTLGGTTSQAFGINASGQVVGYSTTAGGQRHAFLFDLDGSMADLNSRVSANTGWVLTEARGITDTGLIVGQGMNPAGQLHAFLLTIRTVLLIHGTWSDHIEPWTDLKPALESAGYFVSTIDYNLEDATRSNESSARFQARALAGRIAGLLANDKDSMIDLVCHSLGGLGARWYLNHQIDPDSGQPLWPTDSSGNPHAGVRKIIMLGTPNWGTETLGTNPPFIIGVARKFGIQSADEAGGGSYPSDTIDNWSAAIYDMYAEWMPPPIQDDSGIYYPPDFKLAKWPQPNSFSSPITDLSLNYAGLIQDYLYAHLHIDAGDAVGAAISRFNDSTNRFANHVGYYNAQKMLLGISFFPVVDQPIEGVNTRRISQFLYDLNVASFDSSGARVYLIAGYTNIIRIPVPILPDLPGAYTISADGIVPVMSALGTDPISGVSIYPDAPFALFDATHTDLPHRSDVIAQVSTWLNQ